MLVFRGICSRLIDHISLEIELNGLENILQKISLFNFMHFETLSKTDNDCRKSIYTE